MLKLLKDCLKPLYLFLFNRNYRAFARIYSSYVARKRFESSLVKFLDYKINIVDAPSFVYQFKDIFYDEILKFHSMKTNPIILDCGANIGMSCLYFIKLYPGCSITAFEPDPDIFNILKKNVLSNHQEAKIEFINKAVWVHNDGVTFNQEGSDGGSINNSSNKTIKVGSIRLKELLEKQKIDFLKMDIEGAEIEVLLDCGSSLENVNYLFFEYHPVADTPQKLNKVLEVINNAGFRYSIVSSVYNSPFINAKTNEATELQLNIYCYRK